MGTLYIIGNGFDLHFNLKTKTDNFVQCLKTQPVYNEINNALDVLNYYGVDWNEYEQSLNDINLDEIEYQNEIYPDYLSDRESDRDGGILNMQMYVESISDAINSALEQMVKAANNEAMKLPPHNYNKQIFQKGDAILSFNYTSTFEYLFDMPTVVPVFYIHGCYKQGEPLIFGYRNNHNSYPTTWSSMDEDSWDYYIVQQREIVYDFYENWRKKLQLNELSKFLTNCYAIDRIVVLGHSMSAVDAEYMEQIEQSIRPIVWNISYYGETDIKRIQSQNYSFQGKIEFSHMEELLI